MKRTLICTLFILSACWTRAADYYWVGGGGDWSDLNHWRIGSSAGPIAGIVPSSADNVFFDANSGFGATVAQRTVNLNANAYCNNMTWTNVPNNPRFVVTNTIFKIEVWGSLNLSPTTYYQAVFVFRGAAASTLKTNGQVQGNFGMDINKAGGTLTLLDSLVVPSNSTYATNIITLTEGTFDISGKTFTAREFLSNSSNTRVLNMANAGLSLHWAFTYMGTNKTLYAAGSEIYNTGYLQVDGGVYNKVSSYAIYQENFTVFNCTFSKLIFTTPNPLSEARIHDGNIVDTIIFMGAGSIRHNNSVNVISAATSLTISNNNTVGRITNNSFGGAGTGNTVGYWRNGDNFTVSGTGINTVDSLLLAAKSITTFRGTFNINKYLYLDGQPCDAFTAVNGDSVSGSLNFAAGSVVDMDNVILTGVKANGPVIPISVSGIDNGGNAGFSIIPPSASNTTLYWVGGAGDWNDRNHWSTSSGGAAGACIPYIGDDVVFDANSGLASGTVTTSGASFCRNMTWTDVGTVTFSESGTDAFNIFGSLVMDPSVTMNAFLEFEGSDPASIATNGNTLGGLQFIIQKTGSGVVTLADDWSNPTGGSFVHRSGGVNLSGRTVSLVSYASTINAVRSLNITNATLNFTTSYGYRGTGKTLQSTGSHITTVGFAADGLSYPLVDVSGTGGQLAISSTTLGQLTFHSTSATAQASIGAGNTVRRLEFKGRGAVTGVNTIDSLILAGARNYLFAGTNTINKYLEALSTPCAGLSEIKGSPAGTFNFASGALVNMSGVYMQDMTATGPITPVAFNGADAGGNSGWTITSGSAGGRYWVGGTGDWNDPNHWSTTSGGSPGACVPTVYDDVYFDANSGFTAISKTVTVNNGNAYCHNVNWTGATNSPTWSKSASWSIECWGDSVILNPNATFNVSLLTLKGPNPTFMKGSAPLGDFDLYIDKPGGSLTILDNYNNGNTDFQLINGAFNAPGRTLSVRSIDNLALANASSIDISNATIIATAGWRYNGTATNHALNATNSVITATSFTATGFTYNKVNISGTAAAQGTINNTTIDSLTFTGTGTTSAVGINGGNNILNIVEYKGGGAIYGTNNTIDTLIFFPGSTYTFTAGTNTTITGEWYGSGTPCRLTEIYSSSASANATVTKNSGNVDMDFVRLRRITAAGTAIPFTAREHTDDQGNNINWNIAPYNGAASIYGLGPDTAVSEHDFPYTIRTDGFFGSPSSTYLWNNSSTADTLRVTGPGTYSVSVSLADGCNVNDQVVVTMVPVEDADLVATKVLKDASKTNYVPGEDVVYTITVTNNGPDNASDVNITDNAPAGTTINSWTATVQTGTVTLPNASGTGNLNETITTLPNGAVVVYEVTVRTTASTTGSLSNTVAVTTTSVDPDPSCTACTTTPLPKAAVADVVTTKVLKNASKTNYVPGEDLVYTITVTNNGPDNASDVNIADNAPAGTTISNWTATVQTGTVTLPNASGTGNLNEIITSMPNGAVVVYEVTVKTTASTTGSLSNTATVSTTSVDPDPSCAACTTTPLLKAAVADVVTTKALKDATKTNYIPGEDVVYTITVTNNGPDNASDVNITDNAPAGTTINSWTATVQTGTVTLPNTSGTGNLNETIATMPNGAVVVYEVIVRTTASTTGSLSNTVAVTTASVDPDPSCAACTTTPLPKAAVADVVTTKALKDATKTNYIPGEDVMYTITVTNNGPDNASDVNIADNAPAGTTISNWTATVQTGTVTLPNASGTGNLNEIITSIPNGAVVVYEVIVRTTSSTTGSLSNTVAVTTTSVDPDPSCAACTTSALPKGGIADIVTVKTLKNAGQTEFIPGQAVVYTITVTNNGPDDASNVNITDNAPAGTTISSWTGTAQSGTVTLPNASGTGNLSETITTLPNGAVVVYEVSVLTTETFTGTLTNTVQVNTATHDPDPSCASCTASPVTPVLASIANNDDTTAKDGAASVIRVLDNDSPGPSGSPLDPATIEIVSQPAHGTVSLNANGTITYRNNTGYTGNDVFAYRVRDQNGVWSNAATVNIRVIENEVHVPNIITPNGDGKNDKLIIRGLEKYQANQLMIFNRWNNKIYESKNYNGDWSGLGLGAGTYFYTLKVQDKNGQWQTVNGYITLIR